MNNQRAWLVLAGLFCACLWMQNSGRAQSDPATTATTPTAQIQTLGWNQARPLCEYETIEENFDPALTPVEVITASSVAEVRHEGKGRLEIYADGRRVLHLKGTPYEMGLQHGRLLRDDVVKMSNTILITVGLVDTLRTGEAFIDRLRKAYAAAQPYIPADYIEEARGVAEGAGLSHESVLLVNIFPELFHCSGFALWGEATGDGKLYHGRILDYMTEIGLQSVAVVIVSEPEGKNAWVNIGFAGFIGSVTGMNQAQIAVGEMGGRGEGQWEGLPMGYLVRQVLEEADTLDKAVALFRDTPRTCEYYYVVSDAKIPSARGIYGTPDHFEVIEPATAHPRLPHPVKDTVLMSSGDRYKRLAMRAQAHFGAFSAPQALALMRRPVAMKSCLHAVLFCPTDLTFWVAIATKDAQPASEQPYAFYDLKKMLEP